MPSVSTERERWNQKYREKPGAWLEPDPFLAWAFSQWCREQDLNLHAFWALAPKTSASANSAIPA